MICWTLLPIKNNNNNNKDEDRDDDDDSAPPKIDDDNDKKVKVPTIEFTIKASNPSNAQAID